jgi:hypothetical protein
VQRFKLLLDALFFLLQLGALFDRRLVLDVQQVPELASELAFPSASADGVTATAILEMRSASLARLAVMSPNAANVGSCGGIDCARATCVGVANVAHANAPARAMAQATSLAIVDWLRRGLRGLLRVLAVEKEGTGIFGLGCERAARRCNREDSTPPARSTIADRTDKKKKQQDQPALRTSHRCDDSNLVISQIPHSC